MAISLYIYKEIDITKEELREEKRKLGIDPQRLNKVDERFEITVFTTLEIASRALEIFNIS